MKPQTSKQLSIMVALGFAAWVVWLWVDPDKVEKVEKPVVQETEKAPSPSQSNILKQATVMVLPPPPKPAPVQVAPKAVENLEKTQDVKAETQKEVVQPKPQPEPEPLPQPEVKKEIAVVKEKPVKPVVKKEEPVKVAPSQAKPVVHEVTQAQATNGRALLRVLEHGKGPQIEIAWPASSQAREGLYKKFKACFGMENALMDGAGNLYRTHEPSDQRWEINLDKYSGFLRQASGRLPRSEKSAMHEITRHHGYLDDPVPVRIFPRRVDASLLGGLKAVIGAHYMKARSIQARYKLTGSRVVVRDIRLDGRDLPGVIELSRYRRC